MSPLETVITIFLACAAAVVFALMVWAGGHQS
jgi:hypothetical protein